MKSATALNSRRVWPAVFVCLLWTGALLSFPPCAFTDEVDDILKIRARNRDRVQEFSAEFLVEIQHPASVKNRKTTKMRYRMKMEKLPPPQGRKRFNNPWLMEMEVLEPMPMKVRVKGDQVWTLDKNGQWIQMPLTPEIEEQFSSMSERFIGADPAKQRKEFDIKVLRHNNPFFGPKTKTLELKPKGKFKLFHRMEEDVNADGLSLATRIFNETGARIVTIKVTKHRKVNGIPVVEAMETISNNKLNGQIRLVTTMTKIKVKVK